MKKLFTIFAVCFLLCSYTSQAQIFWTENFESGSTSGELVTAYTGPNGTWTLTVTGTEGANFNPWYVSCAENGHTNGVCGTACASVSSTATLATLHIGASTTSTIPLGDNGASYDNGGTGGVFSAPATDRRAESPIINCTGKTSITLSFNYIENGDGTNDDGTVWYFDGSTWSLLVNTPKTLLCGVQGQWAHYAYALPMSANNNPNVKIGFRWVNNDDGVGTDPSFAVDSVSLSTVGSSVTPPHAAFTTSATTVCQDSCITFTSTSTGTIDSITWSIPGISITTPHATPLVQCFTTAGSYAVKLKVYNAGGTDSTTTTITVNGAPHPVIHKTGHSLSVTGTYTGYQWQSNGSNITGATNNNYTYTYSHTVTTYTVLVDSNGCWGSSTLNVTKVNDINTTANTFTLAQTSGSEIDLFATLTVFNNLDIDIYEASGRKVRHEMWQAGDDSKKITNLNIANGLYLIRLSNDNNSTIIKWLKQ